MSSGNVSNISIEEIGRDELEENTPPTDEDAEILLPDEAGHFDTEGLKEMVVPQPEDDPPAAAAEDTVGDPPLEPLVAPVPAEPVNPAADAAKPVEAPAVAEAAPAPAAAAPTPARAPAAAVVTSNRQPPAAVEDDEEDDDDIDETLYERLVGLTEMFPESLTTGSVSLIKGTISLSKSLYNFSRSAGWVIFTTGTVLFLPVMIETERLGLEDQQKQQKSAMLLGPGVASSGGAPSLGPPPI